MALSGNNTFDEEGVFAMGENVDRFVSYVSGEATLSRSRLSRFVAVEAK